MNQYIASFKISKFISVPSLLIIDYYLQLSKEKKLGKKIGTG